MERRLRRAGASDEVVDATLGKLSELGYVDDAAFVAWWAEQRDRHAPRGRRLVEAELRQRGIGREVIEAFRHGAQPTDRGPQDSLLPSSEAERAAAALAGHLRGRPLPTDRKALQRIGMFLVRRGFDPETARAAIRAAGAGAVADETANETAGIATDELS